MEEAIKFLQEQRSLPAFELYSNLSKACHDNVVDIGQKGLAADGKNVSDRIERYCECGESIDFGLKNPREHRGEFNH